MIASQAAASILYIVILKRSDVFASDLFLVIQFLP